MRRSVPLYAVVALVVCALAVGWVVRGERTKTTPDPQGFPAAFNVVVPEGHSDADRYGLRLISVRYPNNTVKKYREDNGRPIWSLVEFGESGQTVYNYQPGD